MVASAWRLARSSRLESGDARLVHPVAGRGAEAQRRSTDTHTLHSALLLATTLLYNHHRHLTVLLHPALPHPLTFRRRPLLPCADDPLPPPAFSATTKYFSTLALQLYTPTESPSPALPSSHSVPLSGCCPGLVDHPTSQIPDIPPKSRIHLRPDQPLLYRYHLLHALDARCPMRSAQ